MCSEGSEAVWLVCVPGSVRVDSATVKVSHVKLSLGKTATQSKLQH